MQHPYEQLRGDYVNMMSRVEVTKSHAAALTAQRIIRDGAIPLYKAIEKLSGVPAVVG